jgi:hypothetical protein
MNKNMRFSNIPAQRVFALAGKKILEADEFFSLMEQVDKEMGLDGNDVCRFSTGDSHLNKTTIRNGGNSVKTEDKKTVAFAIVEYERLGKEAALAACSGDMDKYSQLTLEMEKLAPAFADEGDRQPHMAYGGDDYENPEEAFTDEDVLQGAKATLRTIGYEL